MFILDWIRVRLCYALVFWNNLVLILLLSALTFPYSSCSFPSINHFPLVMAAFIECATDCHVALAILVTSPLMD